MDLLPCRHRGKMLATGNFEGVPVHRATLALSASAVVLAGVVTAPFPADATALYRSHHWFELQSALTKTSPPLFRAAVAVAFNQPADAERRLRDVIRSRPSSDDADDAYYLLSRIYLRSGQYVHFIDTCREWHATHPDSAQLRAQQPDIDKLSGRPDQTNESVRSGTAHHEPDEFTVPVTVNGKTDAFLIDTGAWQSVLTDREAKKLGVSVEEQTRTLTGSSGNTAHFRTAVAKDIVVDATTFHDVSFAVLDPTGPLGDAEGGIVGMPILLATGTVRWSKNGDVELGRSPKRSRAAQPNLAFDRDRLLVRSEAFGQTVLATLDTGATTTDLNENFALRFSGLIQRGKRTKQEITGVSGTMTFDAIELPEVAFTIGGLRSFLRPAKVTLQRIALIGGDCCVGNVGLDLLRQGQELTIDLSAMTLTIK
jgi:predicted aspartyl protease